MYDASSLGVKVDTRCEACADHNWGCQHLLYLCVNLAGSARM